MYRIYRKILNSDQGDFQILVNSGVLEEISGCISGSLPENQEGFTCMSTLSWLVFHTVLLKKSGLLKMSSVLDNNAERIR